jgi:hypothetical protein
VSIRVSAPSAMQWSASASGFGRGEHKMSGINYLLNRLNTYPITDEAKEKEQNTIKNNGKFKPVQQDAKV